MPPLLAGAFYGLFLAPPGIIGGCIAATILLVRLDPAITRNANRWWWIVTLLGLSWTFYWFLALGVSFADW